MDDGAFRERAIAQVRAQVATGKVICGLSGGVDSSAVAVLLHDAIGDQLQCVFVGHGLLRVLRDAEVLLRDLVAVVADAVRPEVYCPACGIGT